jgi:predicted transcriptional regulator
MRDEDFRGLIAGLEASGIKRSEIARSAGISRQTVWRIATGQAQEPYFSTIRRIKEIGNKGGPVTPINRKIG